MSEIAIIIPAYNIEKYIGRCLNSVIGQSIRNFDVLLIDDGSTDNTGSICDEYADKDSRINVFHKANGGLSDARNFGLEHLQDDTIYITFIDGDDWVSPFYLENMLKALKTSDACIATGYFEKVFEGKKINSRPHNKLCRYRKLSSMQYLKCMLYQAHTDTSAWAKLYRREIIEGLRYPIGKLYEDIPVTYQAIKSCDSIAMFDNIDYYYYQRKSSIQNMDFNVQKMDGVYYMSELMKDVKQSYPQLSKASECRYISTVCNIYFQIPQENRYRGIRLHLENEIKKYRKNILHDINARKKTWLACLLSYCGFDFMKTIYYMMQ